MTDPDLYRRIEALEKRLEEMASTELARPIASLYDTTAGQSIPNTIVTIVDFETEVSDPDNLVTTGASWAFTAPIAGLYDVTTAIMFAGSTAWALGTKAGAFFVYKNGAIYERIDRKDNFAAGTSQFMQLGGSCCVICAAGDTIDVRVSQNTGGALALSTAAQSNYVHIRRVN